MRTFLARLEPRTTRVLFLNLHHIVSDGWVHGDPLVRELTTLYGAFSRGLPFPAAPPELPLQYAEHASRGSGGVSPAGSWRRASSTGAAASTGRRSPWTCPGTGPGRRSGPPAPRAARWPARLEAPAAGALQALAREGGASPFMALLATFAPLLYRLGGGDDLVVGTPISNRDRRETEGMIGLLLNTLALRVDLSGDAVVPGAARPGAAQRPRRLRPRRAPLRASGRGGGTPAGASSTPRCSR